MKSTKKNEGPGTLPDKGIKEKNMVHHMTISKAGNK